MQTIKERLESSVRSAGDETSKEVNFFRFKNTAKCCTIM